MFKKKFSFILGNISLFFRCFIIRRKLKRSKYNCVYIGTPFYGNLGDQQIRTSALEFLKSLNIKYIEIDYRLYWMLKTNKYKHIKTICLQGGGNLGDVYLEDEMLRDDVIRTHRDKKIIIFPQTLYFEKSSETGDAKIIKSIFETHDNLTLVAREKISFESMKKEFPSNKILLTPDIVLSSDYTKKYNKHRKNQILFLCRSDKEKVVSNEKIDLLKNTLAKDYKIIEDDTETGYYVYDVMRDKELSVIFNKIAKSKIVVTDRLHGMIFCAITNTPCIVLSNYNHKIKSTYENWLKKFGFIKFVESLDSADINKIISELSTSKTKFEPLTEEFKPLVEEIKNKA